jgi:hypothetical protein
MIFFAIRRIQRMLILAAGKCLYQQRAAMAGANFWHSGHRTNCGSIAGFRIEPIGSVMQFATNVSSGGRQ